MPRERMPAPDWKTTAEHLGNEIKRLERENEVLQKDLTKAEERVGELTDALETAHARFKTLMGDLEMAITDEVMRATESMKELCEELEDVK